MPLRMTSTATSVRRVIEVSVAESPSTPSVQFVTLIAVQTRITVSIPKITGWIPNVKFAMTSVTV